jgi:hypothetical protein
MQNAISTEVIVASIAQESSLFEIDRELGTLLDEIEKEIESRGEATLAGWTQILANAVKQNGRA